MERIAATFDSLRSRGQAALMPYLMVGYPSMEATRQLLLAIVDAGADLVELGIPFSDPMADGATLQRINHLALEAGGNLRTALDLVASVRAELPVPLVLMTYYNPLLRLGDEGFAREAAAAGADGVIVPDLPIEESDSLAHPCAAAGVDLVGMVAPTSPQGRISSIAGRAAGFVYCVSLRGVTGARSQLPQGVDRLVHSVRQATDLPVAVGFGISTTEHVRRVASFADGAVVGSALMGRIAAEPDRPYQTAARFVSELKAACRP